MTMDLENLIVVPGHGIYLGREPSCLREQKFWVSDYPDEIELYLQHAEAGVKLAAGNPKALLVFSGGQTKEQAGPFSEAQGYWFLSEQLEWFGYPEVSSRAVTEEFARDSWENLQFSICRFQHYAGHQPRRVTVCCFQFKEQRYKFHAKTVGLEKEKFMYLGLNNPPPEILRQSLMGEQKAFELFQRFPHGERGALLEKKLQRDPFNRGNPYKAWELI